MSLSVFLKEKRANSQLTQIDLAEKAGVGLRFIRDLEQGKETLRLDKVNQVLKLFGYVLGPVEMNRNLQIEPQTGNISIKSFAPKIKITKKKK